MASHISVHQLINGAAIAQNNSDSEIVDLSRFNAEGFFSLQIELVGAGQVDVTWSVSNDGENFITPTGTDPIFDDFDATSGPNADGIDIASFDVLLARYLKVTVTENNVGAITSCMLHLAIQ